MIKDCIHGFISIPHICMQFMDTPEFQRLRDIKQLGVTHYVYPTAVHTRFEHCLGVMHLAGKAVAALIDNGVVITTREKHLVQLAGLLHDTGHVALSHLLDTIVTEKAHTASHEKRSVQILKCINKRVKILNEREEAMVAKMILGESYLEDCPFLFEIVNNKIHGIDVDRLDYLQRDAYYTGFPGFNSSYLIKTMRVQDRHLTFAEKARYEIQALYETRRRMFIQVYRHKTTLRIERLFREMIESSGIVDEILDRTDTDWKAIDDTYVMTILKRSPLFVALYERSWDKSPINNPLEHCTNISREDIDHKLSNISFV